MARTSKFSFPLPGRSLITTKGSKVDEPLSHPNKEILQMANGKQSKAERLLGATDFGPLDNKPTSARPKETLREKPSFVSISVSEFGQDHTLMGDENFNPSATAGSWGPPRLSPRGLFPRPSSPLLGRHFHESTIRTEKQEGLPNNGLHKSRSSSTLRSYYDPANSPLSISQQTSASSARDMALRKGCEPVIGSQHRSGFRSAVDLAGINSDEQSYNCESPRKRPPRLDFSRLFPRHRIFSGSLLSPHRVTKSPSALSTVSDVVPLGPIYAEEMYLGANNSRGSLSASNDRQSSYFVPLIEPTVESNLGAKRPMQEIEPWSNGVEGDAQMGAQAREVRSFGEAAYNLQCAHTVRNSSGARHPSMTRLPPKPQSSAHFSKSHECLIRMSSPYEEANSTHSPTSPKSRISRKSTGSAFTNSDLQNESVLTLSSSEDEDQFDGQASTCNSRRCHRNIPALTNRHGNVTIDGANSIHTSRPAKPHAHPESIISSGSRDSTISARSHIIARRNGMPRATFLRPPSMSSTRPNRAPDRRGAESHSENFRPKSSNDATSRSPIPLGGLGPTPGSPPRSESGLTLRKSRIMAVTREEESLLEAMRQKKAAMRKHKADAVNGQNSEQSCARPISAISKKELRFAHEPLPAAYATSASNLGIARSRTSGFLDSASISSDLWSNGTTSITYLPAPKFSPNLHFTPSEYTSSTAPSRASPKTPPLQESASLVTDPDGPGMTALPAARIVQAKDDFEHYREGSRSSDVLELHRDGGGEAVALA